MSKDADTYDNRFKILLTGDRYNCLLAPAPSRLAMASAGAVPSCSYVLKEGCSSSNGERANGGQDSRPMRPCARIGSRGVAAHCCVPWHMPHRVSRRHGVARRRGATPCHTNTTR